MITKTSKPLVIDGSMYANNIAQIVVVGVVDTYYQIGGGLTGGAEKGMTFQNSREIKALKAGKYSIDYAISAYTAAANNEIETTCMINGTAQTNTTSHVEQVTASNPNTTAGHGILTLAANDLVSLAVSNHTGATNIIVEHVLCKVIYLGA